MKRRITLLLTLIFVCSVILSAVFIANADDSTSNETVLTCRDLVETNNGVVEFKEIDTFFKKYNINNHSDKIDTVNTIDKVMVLSAQGSDTTFTFKTHLNRDKLDKYFNIVEWFIVPTKRVPFSEETNWGNVYSDTDFDSFEITITDVNNPDKYVIFRTTNSPDSNTQAKVVSGRVGANNQAIEGVHHEDLNEINKSWGARIDASHVGCFDKSKPVPVGFNQNLPLGGFLSLDYETKEVFSVTGSDNGRRYLIRDLDSGKHMTGTDVPWEGFDSKELEVSIKFINVVSGRTAQVAILSFNGMDFTKGAVIDNKAPEVLESTVFDAEQLYGEVGRAMPIMDCYSYDLLDGFGTDITYKVFYEYEDESKKQEILINDGRFTPIKKGKYSIIATASDRYGNVGSLKRDIEVYEALRGLDIALESELPSTCKVGERVYVPNAFVYGGTLNKKYEVAVYFNGKAIDIDDDYFVASTQGLYTVKYVVSDYYKQPIDFDYTVVATINDAPIAYFPDLAEVVETGVKLNIPEFFAKDYSSFGDGVDADLSFEIIEPSGTTYTKVSRDFIPQEDGAYKLRITASCIADKSKSVSQEYDFVAKTCTYVRDYFVTDNIEIINKDRKIGFNVLGEKGSLYFINPVLNNRVMLRFNITNQNEDAPVVIITLSDSLNKDKQISLRIEKNSFDTSVMTYLDTSCVIKGAVGSEKPGFKIAYRNGFLYDGDDAIFKINKYANGKVFDGFSSGKVYVNIAIENAGGENETVLKFSEFCGHTSFSYNSKDNGEPIVIYSDLSRVCSIGEEISFTYTVFDLFDTESTISAYASFDGSVLSSGQNGKCTFTITGFGKYTAVLQAQDKFGNNARISLNIYCYDNIAPTLNVVDNVDRKCDLGDDLSLPTAIVKDNIDTNLGYSIYAKRPTGSFVIIENNRFVPDVKGTWIIYYYTVDACGNYALISFEVAVS